MTAGFRLKHPVHRHDLPRHACARGFIFEGDFSAADVLKVFQNDGVKLAGLERDDGAVADGRMGGPIINDGLTVEVEPDTVVRPGVEGVGGGGGREELSAPAHAEAVRTEAGDKRIGPAARDTEIDRGISPSLKRRSDELGCSTGGVLEVLRGPASTVARTLHPVEGRHLVRSLGVGELILAGGHFGGRAQHVPIAQRQSGVRDAPHDEAQAAEVGEAQSKRAARQQNRALQHRDHGLAWNSREHQIPAQRGAGAVGGDQPKMIRRAGVQRVDRAG